MEKTSEELADQALVASADAIEKAYQEQIDEDRMAYRFARPDDFDPSVAGDINDRWKQPCEAMFEYLAKNFPAQLVALLRSSRLSHADLTFAAEIAGSIHGSAIVRPALLGLLEHTSPVVREGAIYGLANHLDEASRTRLQRIASDDPSRAVRTAARGALEAPRA